MLQVKSSPLIGIFATKPLAPTKFKLGNGPTEIIFEKSASPGVRYMHLFIFVNFYQLIVIPPSDYKVRYKSSEEGSKAEEIILSPGDTFLCSVQLKVGV